MTARYDLVSDEYAGQNPDRYEAGPDVALLELAGDVAGRRVLDVACGHGRMSRELARRGGTEVVGVDVSVPLIHRARQAEGAEPLGVRYVIGDVSAAPDVGGPFDLATCHFGLSDIDDLDGALATVARALRPGGPFVFSVLHPCFPGWGADVAPSWPPGGYFREGWWRPTAARSTLRRQVGITHRTLATYLNTLTRRGLVLEAVREPPPPPEWAGQDPVPVFLVARCRAHLM